METYQDSFNTVFSSFDGMFRYHGEQAQNSTWERTEIHELTVEPLDKNSDLYQTRNGIAAEVSSDAIEDTAENLKLALMFNGQYYPMRDTCWRGILDRAKISGSVLPSLPKDDLARVLNTCLSHHRKSSALILIRDEKITATHSGDERDYSVLPINELLDTVVSKLDDRFTNIQFEAGFSTHSITSAAWSLPDQKEDLLKKYCQILESKGKSKLASKLMPGVRFTTSDTGVSSAKVSALLYGMEEPIYIGSVLAVDHRGQKTIGDFAQCMDQLFMEYTDTIGKLSALTGIILNYPVNAMRAVAKKLTLPKKASDNAVEMFEAAYGEGQATAHDVFFGLQEVIFNMKREGASQFDMLTQQENLSRALFLRWRDYDRMGSVS